MGFYLNTEVGKEEAFLDEKGEKLENAPNWSQIPEDKVAVCLVNGGLFVGAFLCQFEHELENCKKIRLGRNKAWYLCPKSSIP